MPAIAAYQKGVVYFLLLSDSRTKIGVTSNLHQRIEAHVQNGLDVVQDGLMSFMCYPARQVENHFHGKFKDKRISREFFSLTFNDWMSAAEEAMYGLSIMGEPCVQFARFPDWSEPSVCPNCEKFFFGKTLHDPNTCLFCTSKLERRKFIRICQRED